MKFREEIMEKIESGEFQDALFMSAEKATFILMKQSILPLWKGTPGYKEALKKRNIKTVRDLRPTKAQKRRSNSHLTRQGSENGDMIQMEEA